MEDIEFDVHKMSNHHPNVLKQVPISINKRLCNISSSEEEFNNAAPDYQKALQESGYEHRLVYEEPAQRSNRRSRTRDVMWFNPPYNKSVTTNIGAAFLRLIDKHFPKTNPLSRIINRNTVKVSYSCTKNMKQLMQSHNMKILNQEKKESPKKKCNCQRHNRENCPLNGRCVQTDAIYHAEVRNGDDDAVNRKYVGSTVHFKRRYYGHTESFRHEAKKNSTALSAHVWDKGLNPEPDIEWSILGHAPAYKPGNKNCDLCLTEKAQIARNFSKKEYLNKRTEIAQKCRHKSRYLLQPPTRGEDEET